MARFIAVHTHRWKEEELLELTQKAKEHIKGTGTSFKQSYCDFDDGKFFCEWEAPNKEALQNLFSWMRLPFDTIYPVRLFSAAKMNFID